MKTEAAPRNTDKPGDKIGRYSGRPVLLGFTAMTDRLITRRILYSLRGPMDHEVHVRED